MERLLSTSGLLHRANVTRILVTHDRSFLPSADTIFAIHTTKLAKEAEILNVGHYSNLATVLEDGNGALSESAKSLLRTLLSDSGTNEEINLEIPALNSEAGEFSKDLMTKEKKEKGTLDVMLCVGIYVRLGPCGLSHCPLRF